MQSRGNRRTSYPNPPPCGHPMRTLKTSEAAALLNVSPNTLRAWERRFGYPAPAALAGSAPAVHHGEVAALRDALQEGLSISSAVSPRARGAQRRTRTSSSARCSSFELERADLAMEAALALRSLERSVEEVLLPSFDELASRTGIDSAPWAFAARWADGWLRRAQRLSPAPARNVARSLMGDATRDELDPDALAVRALELFLAPCGRARLEPAGDAASPVSATSLEAHPPDRRDHRRRATLPTTTSRAGRTSARSASGPLPIMLFRRPARSGSVRATARALPEGPFEAHRVALGALEETPARSENRFQPGARHVSASAAEGRHVTARAARRPGRRSTAAPSRRSAGTAAGRPRSPSSSPPRASAGAAGSGSCSRHPRASPRRRASRSSSSTAAGGLRALAQAEELLGVPETRAVEPPHHRVARPGRRRDARAPRTC